MNRREEGGRVPVECVIFGKSRVDTEATEGQLVSDLLKEVGMTPRAGQEVLVNARVAQPDTRITETSTVVIANRVTGG